jgi:hypothetical protein
MFKFPWIDPARLTVPTIWGCPVRRDLAGWDFGNLDGQHGVEHVFNSAGHTHFQIKRL